MGVNQRHLIRMSESEVEEFLHGRHSMSVATTGPDGRVHLVAMWYGFLEGDLAIETKAKSQKIQNLRRDPRTTVLVESGELYEELKGVEIVGRGELIDDPPRMFALGVDLFERYYGAYTDDLRSAVEAMLNKRVVVKIHREKVVSWDHTKLGQTIPTSQTLGASSPVGGNG